MEGKGAHVKARHMTLEQHHKLIQFGTDHLVIYCSVKYHYLAINAKFSNCVTLKLYMFFLKKMYCIWIFLYLVFCWLLDILIRTETVFYQVFLAFYFTVRHTAHTIQRQVSIKSLEDIFKILISKPWHILISTETFWHIMYHV